MKKASSLLVVLFALTSFGAFAQRDHREGRDSRPVPLPQYEERPDRFESRPVPRYERELQVAPYSLITLRVNQDIVNGRLQLDRLVREQLGQ